MCVIYSCGSSLPPEEELKRGAFKNDDGAGVAWLDRDPEGARISWKKGLKNSEEVLAFIKEAKIPFPLAIHFRSASVGGKCPELCHPFPIAKDVPLWTEGYAPEVLFHNGHLGDWEETTLKAGLTYKGKFPLPPWSDSRSLAWLVYLKGAGILEFVLGSSRVLLFSADSYTEEGSDYNPATDHFRHYGAWLHPEKAWSQSTTTDYAGGNVVCINDKRWSRQEEAAPVSKSSVANVWTVEELTEILTKIEKEQGDAKLAIGS